jgi:hypothetical protein
LDFSSSRLNGSKPLLSEGLAFSSSRLNGSKPLLSGGLAFSSSRLNGSRPLLSGHRSRAENTMDGDGNEEPSVVAWIDRSGALRRAIHYTHAMIKHKKNTFEIVVNLFIIAEIVLFFLFLGNFNTADDGVTMHGTHNARVLEVTADGVFYIEFLLRVLALFKSKHTLYNPPTILYFDGTLIISSMVLDFVALETMFADSHVFNKSLQVAIILRLVRSLRILVTINRFREILKTFAHI